MLQAAGYQTALVGNWHLASAPTGFDHYEVLVGHGPYYNPRLAGPDGSVYHEGYVTDVITERALDWLRDGRDAERPFLLVCQHKAAQREWAPSPDRFAQLDGADIPEPATLFDDYAGRASAARSQETTLAHLTPHDLKFARPRTLTPKQLGAWNAAYVRANDAFHSASFTEEDIVRWKYQRFVKDYLGCVASLDESLGRVLDYLEEAGLADDTVVVYSSDTGCFLGDHGWFGERWMYEESLRTPLVVRWPGAVRPGSEDLHLVQNIDLAPTFLALAGVDVPVGMHGESLLPLLREEDPPWRESVYYHYSESDDAHRVAQHRGVRTERYKLIHYYELGEWELFDLEQDPRELASVFDDPGYADVRARLESELERLRSLYGDD
jgi:arylsulfatase A-like enzyme